MPFLRLTCDAGNSSNVFGNEIFGWKSQLDDITCDANCQFFMRRQSFPDDEEKRKLVQLLLAEGLIEEKPGEIMEDLAAKYIDELIVLGMLREFDNGTRLQVHYSYRKLSICKVEKHDFVTACANTSLRADIICRKRSGSINILLSCVQITYKTSLFIGFVEEIQKEIIKATKLDDGKDNPPNFKGLIIQYLFILPDRYTHCISGAYMKAVCELNYLVVLDLWGKIECLPDEVGDLVHLRYLALRYSYLKNELPTTISKLQKLQTLDFSMWGWPNKIQLPSIQQLRHLIMSNGGEIRVPKEIGTLVNLHTCDGLYAGGGIAKELGRLTQLRQLGVKGVSEDHASELAASIMKMVDLISLSLEAEESSADMYMLFSSLERYHESMFPSLEPFSPPPLLQDLLLCGLLVEIPNWVASMENLTKLDLCYSYLSENPTSVLQFLPKLKHLCLWQAYKAKRIGKEFCEVGGFARLETLTIASYFLVEWTEIENGALPSLKQLSFYNCEKLMFLPESLQNIFTLEYLYVGNCHNDLVRRLNGEENYKIKHIPKVEIIPPRQETYPDRERH